MKTTTIQRFIKLSFHLFLIVLLFLGCSSSYKTTKLNSDEIRNMVDSSQFIFVAERVKPLRGRTRHLTSLYEVVVKEDTLDCDLPFFGRAYRAPLDPSKGGIHFTSSDFIYNKNSKKENEWEISIKPKDVNDVQQLLFNIFTNGTATLNVVNTYRDQISFYGHIERVKNDH